jgi:hypothetical protein
MSANFLEKLVFDAYKGVPTNNRTPLFTARIIISLLFTLNALSIFLLYEEVRFSLHGFEFSSYLIPSKFEFMLFSIGAIVFVMLSVRTKNLNNEGLIAQLTDKKPNYFIFHIAVSIALLLVSFYFL